MVAGIRRFPPADETLTWPSVALGILHYFKTKNLKWKLKASFNPFRIRHNTLKFSPVRPSADFLNVSTFGRSAVFPVLFDSVR